MPKDLKIFLMACVAIPLLLIFFLALNSFSRRPNDIVTDLELNRFKMHITIEEDQSWLTSEMRYFKATLTREEAAKLRKWLTHYHQPDTFARYYMPGKLEGKADWRPPKTKTALHGYFFKKSFYRWHCNYLIAPVNKDTSVFYLYAVDYFN
jgi:hypothetical protein